MSNEVKFFIGNRMASVRNEKNLTQEDLAEKTGMNAKTISVLETVPKDLKVSSLFAISNALEVTADYLLTGRILHESLINLRSDKLNSRIANLSPEQYAILESIIDLYLASTELNCSSYGNVNGKSRSNSNSISSDIESGIGNHSDENGYEK